MATVKVTGFDHIVLRVADVERSLAWYTEVLGLEPVRVEEWRREEVPFPSVRINSTSLVDLVASSRRDDHVLRDGERNVDHFCLVVAPCDLSALRSAFTVVDGPGPRFGALGVATSLYVLDPDGNTVELRHYGA